MINLILPIIIGLILIIIGTFNMKGNLSSLHFYHYKRVKKEDKLVFGRIVGLGSIIIGFTTIFAAIFSFLFGQPFQPVINIILTSGFLLGFILIFYALFKYNKGIF